MTTAADLTDDVVAETVGAIDAVPGEAGVAAAARRFASADYGLILLLGSVSALGPLAIDMYLPSFPTIAKQMNVGVGSVERTMAAYFAGLAIGQLFYGPAGDRFGRRLPLFVGLALFIVGSAGCGLARSVPALVGLRFVQALGGCAEMVIARAVVRDRFAARDAARVFSALMLVMGLAPILAPLAGGWLVVHASWRAVFAAQAVAGLACLVAVAVFLPESLPVDRRERRSPAAIVAVYGQLLRHRLLIAHAMAGSLVLAGLFAYVAGSPFVFITLFHVPESHFWMFFGTNAAGLIASSQVNGWLVQRADPRRVLRGGLIAATVAGTLLLFAAATGAGGFVGLLVPLFAFLCCFGFILPTSTALAMAPHGRVAGAASAVLGAVQFAVSGLAGVAVSALHNGTAVPMAAAIAVAGGAALAVNLLLARE